MGAFLNWLECRTCGVGVGVHTVDLPPGSTILEEFRREHEGHRLTLNGVIEMTRQEWLESISANTGMAIQTILEARAKRGRYPMSCDCGDEICQGWEWSDPPYEEVQHLWVGPTEFAVFPEDAQVGDRCDTGGQRWTLTRKDSGTLVWSAVITADGGQGPVGVPLSGYVKVVDETVAELAATSGTPLELLQPPHVGTSEGAP